MTERGMIFNAPMVRAILGGSKTQTRRIVKLSHERGWKNPVVRGKNGEASYVGCRLATLLCPFGQPGDRIWVRETFRVHSRATDLATVVYKASERQSWTEQTHRVPIEDCNKPAVVDKWTPSIHMLRWASRITLEITDVRVERLNSISEADAAAEGVGSDIWFAAKGVPEDEWSSLGEHGAERAIHINTFATLWESIYGAESWQANPWVWVIEFRRVEGG